MISFIVLLAICVMALMYKVYILHVELRQFKRYSEVLFRKIDRELDAVVEQFYILESEND